MRNLDLASAIDLHGFFLRFEGVWISFLIIILDLHVNSSPFKAAEIFI